MPSDSPAAAQAIVEARVHDLSCELDQVRGALGVQQERAAIAEATAARHAREADAQRARAEHAERRIEAASGT